jgi:hypothetical protein
MHRCSAHASPEDVCRAPSSLHALWGPLGCGCRAYDAIHGEPLTNDHARRNVGDVHVLTTHRSRPLMRRFELEENHESEVADPNACIRCAAREYPPSHDPPSSLGMSPPTVNTIQGWCADDCSEVAFTS